MRWCHWTLHTLAPIDLYSNHMSISHRLPLIATQYISHRLALIATQYEFSYLLSLGPYYEKWQVQRMTPKWHWTLKGQRYPIYFELLPTSRNVTPFCSTIARFPYNLGVFCCCFSIEYNGKFEIFAKIFFKKIGNSNFQKSPTLFSEDQWGGFRTGLKTFSGN